MKNTDEKPKSVSDIQIDQLLREIETEEGRKRIGDEAFKEAQEAEKRKSINNSSNH